MPLRLDDRILVNLMERIRRERQALDAEETTDEHPDDVCSIMPPQEDDPNDLREGEMV